MGEDVALHIGAAEFTWSNLRWIAGMVLLATSVSLIPWRRWHLREWRIRRAAEQGDHDRAELLALDHDYQDRPRTLGEILKTFVFMLIGLPVLMVFQQNFIETVEQMMGPGWSFVAAMLTLAFLFACGRVWQQVKRNAMSPEELAALEEEEEHQRWMRSIDGDSMPGLFVAIAFGAAILAGLYFLFAAITPG